MESSWYRPVFANRGLRHLVFVLVGALLLGSGIAVNFEAKAQSSSLLKGRERFAQIGGELEAACERGDAAACAKGGAHWSNITRYPNFALAGSLYEAACASGSAEACKDAGYLYDVYQNKFGNLPSDPSKAAPLYRAGCNGGESEACYRLGLLHGRGAGVAKVPTEYVGLLTKACDGKIAAACSDLAAYYAKEPAASQAEATKLLGLACENGDLQACAITAPTSSSAANKIADACIQLRDLTVCDEAVMVFQHGLGPTKKDRHRAAQIFEKICGPGKTAACLKSGDLYRTAASPDPAAAAKVYAQGCDDPIAPNIDSCVSLAEMKLAGEGMPGDLSSALATFQTYCFLQKHPRACAALGFIYARAGRVQDAIPVLQQACDAREGRACAVLGTMHGNGQIGEKDLVSALHFIDLGCKYRASTACLMMANLVSQGVSATANSSEMLAYYYERTLEIDPENKTALRGLATAVVR